MDYKDYFDRNKDRNEVYECGGHLFHDRGSAQSSGLGIVTAHSREETEAAAASKTDENNNKKK